MAVSVHSVAKYILQKRGPMSAMKLQKLAYYCQAWSLVWDDKPLFKEKIEAWANGPVVPALYKEHRGDFKVDSWPQGALKDLNHTQKETIDAVLGYYGDKSAHWLSELTHMEEPWRQGRSGLGDGERGKSEITHACLAEYYSGLV